MRKCLAYIQTNLKILLVGVLIVLFFALYDTTRLEPPNIVGHNIPKKEFVEYWQHTITTKGPESALNQVRAYAQQIPPLTQHDLSHTFGNALYKKYGTRGLMHCGGDYLGGCFHEIMAYATSDLGYGAIPELFETCQQSRDAYSCIHGIGHGLMASSGYQSKDVDTALTACSELEAPYDQICADGVFMEYSLHNFTYYQEPRELTDEEAHQPCLDLKDSPYYTTCIYRVGSWWFDALEEMSYTPEQQVAYSVGRCQEDSVTDKDVCYFGLGSHIVSTSANRSVPEFVTLCEGLENAGERAMNLCLIGAARMYRVLYPEKIASANAQCELFNVELHWQPYCVAFHDRSPIPFLDPVH